jgi:hypothetical protein
VCRMAAATQAGNRLLLPCPPCVAIPPQATPLCVGCAVSTPPATARVLLPPMMQLQGSSMEALFTFEPYHIPALRILSNVVAAARHAVPPLPHRLASMVASVAGAAQPLALAALPCGHPPHAPPHMAAVRPPAVPVPLAPAQPALPVPRAVYSSASPAPPFTPRNMKRTSLHALFCSCIHPMAVEEAPPLEVRSDSVIGAAASEAAVAAATQPAVKAVDTQEAPGNAKRGDDVSARQKRRGLRWLLKMCGHSLARCTFKVAVTASATAAHVCGGGRVRAAADGTHIIIPSPPGGR